MRKLFVGFHALEKKIYITEFGHPPIHAHDSPRADANINYKYTAQHIDTNDAGSKIKMKSTDIINMSLSKKLSGNIFSINISNLLDERYERPATYGQEGRKIRLGFKRIY